MRVAASSWKAPCAALCRPNSSFVTNPCWTGRRRGRGRGLRRRRKAASPPEHECHQDAPRAVFVSSGLSRQFETRDVQVAVENWDRRRSPKRAARHARSVHEGAIATASIKKENCHGTASHATFFPPLFLRLPERNAAHGGWCKECNTPATALAPLQIANESLLLRVASGASQK